MLCAKTKDAAEQSASRWIFRRRTLHRVASEYSCTGPRRIAGAGADGGVVPFPAENRRSCSHRNTLVIATIQSFVVVTTSVRQQREQLVPYEKLAAASGEKLVAEKKEVMDEVY